MPMACEKRHNCEFFSEIMVNMPKSSNYIKEKYCLGHYESCARYRIYKEFGEELIPDRLLPSDADFLFSIQQSWCAPRWIKGNDEDTRNEPG
jgi:hypothetical protein